MAPFCLLSVQSVTSALRRTEAAITWWAEACTLCICAMEPLVSVPLTCSLLFPSDSNAPSVNTVSPRCGAQGPAAQSCAWVSSACLVSAFVVKWRNKGQPWSLIIASVKQLLIFDLLLSGASYNPAAISFTHIVRSEGWDDCLTTSWSSVTQEDFSVFFLFLPRQVSSGLICATLQISFRAAVLLEGVT